MFLKEAPLARHVSFHVASRDQLAETVAMKLGARCLQLPTTRLMDATANHFRLRESELWYCAYGSPISLQFDESNYIRLQLRYAGAGVTKIGREKFAVSKSQGCISSAAAIIDFGADFEQLVWRIPREVITRKLVALTGRAISRPLAFDPVLNLEDPACRELLRIVNCLLVTIEQAQSSVSQFVLAEMEQALIVALLCRSQHNFRHWLDGATPAIAPWQVRRAEEYIEANWNKPFSIEDIAEACGASARSIQRTFKETRQCSPMEFAKGIRLQRARALLEDGKVQLNVTDVALICGFSDISHFSRDFSRAYGIAPSMLVRQRRP